MEPSAILASVRRHWRLSVAILVLAGAGLAAFLFTRNEIRQPDLYRTAVQVQIPARDDKGVPPEGVPGALLQGQQQLAWDQVGPVRDDSGLPEEEARRVSFNVSQNENRSIMTLSATSLDPDQSTELANRFARAYISARAAVMRERSVASQQSSRTQLDRLTERLQVVTSELEARNVPLPEIVPSGTGDGADRANLDLPAGFSQDVVLLLYERNHLSNQISDLYRRYGVEAANSLTPNSFADIVERSRPEQVTPEPPSPLIPAGIALGAGLLLALAVPVLRDMTDHTIRDPKGASTAFSAPVLSAIPAPARNDRYALAAPGSTRDAAFRSLAATSVATNRLPRAIMVTSPVGHVQDTVAANFAASLANLGLRVALVATAPRQSWYASSSSENGDWVLTLPDLLELAHSGRLNGEVRHGLLKTPLPNLVVVPPGTSEDLELSLDGLPPLLAALRSGDVDVTVIAGQPLLEDPNATIFAWATRSVLWAVESGAVTEAQAKEAAARMELAGVTSFGVTIIGSES